MAVQLPGIGKGLGAEVANVASFPFMGHGMVRKVLSLLKSLVGLTLCAYPRFDVMGFFHMLNELSGSGEDLDAMDFRVVLVDVAQKLGSLLTWQAQMGMFLLDMLI